MYVSDLYNRIQCFSLSGSFLAKWGKNGTGEGEFQSIDGIAVGPNGYIYVSDKLTNRIQYFKWEE